MLYGVVVVKPVPPWSTPKVPVDTKFLLPFVNTGLLAVSEESMMSARRMSERFVECINTCLTNWTPRKKFTLFKVEQETNFDKVGVI